MGWSPRPPGRNVQHHWTLTSEDSDEDLGSQLAGSIPTATFRKKRLSTVEDLENSSEQAEPQPDPLAAEEEPRTSASLNKECQETEALQDMSWPKNPRMPGISDSPWQRRRDLKKRAAAVGLLPPAPALSLGTLGPCMIPSCGMEGAFTLHHSGSSGPKHGAVHSVPTSAHEVTRPSSFLTPDSQISQDSFLFRREALPEDTMTSRRWSLQT